MRGRMRLCRGLLIASLALAAGRAAADPIQCVPYARQVSGIQLHGDAWTWWDQAAEHYRRGNVPQVGAVLAFKPYGAMRLGHVATVSRIIDERTILVRHANWSPIDGERGQIEDDVRVVDVSPDNDWSAVRVWYAPLGDLGTTHWPTHGFIYPDRRADTTLARARQDADMAAFARLLDRRFLARIDRIAAQEARDRAPPITRALYQPRVIRLAYTPPPPDANITLNGRIVPAARLIALVRTRRAYP